MAKKTIPELLAHTGDPQSYKKVGNNRLHLHYGDGIEAFRLHHTNVVTIDRAKRTATLDTGGWPTKTTSKAMREGLAMFGINASVAIRKRAMVLYHGRDWSNPVPFDGSTFTIDI